MRRVLGSLIVLTVLWMSTPGRPVDLGHARLAVETRSAFEQGDTIAVRFAGRFSNESTEPSHVAYSGELRSLATGEVVGTMTHDLTCAGAAGLPCPVVDVVNTFRFPEGTIVNRALESIAADPQHPGFALSGNHPDSRSITSGTGAFAGRTGRAHMSGHHDGREFPAYVTFDDFWLIELDPR
jgi:hypothetical protein